jgi:hypothetical protein
VMTRHNKRDVSIAVSRFSGIPKLGNKGDLLPVAAMSRSVLRPDRGAM